MTRARAACALRRRRVASPCSPRPACGRGLMVRCKVCYITRDRGSPGSGERIHGCLSGTGATSPATSADNVLGS
eukprot:scaffold6009_cov350-Prasinococcus_capsulatus_cf.AAC.1